MKYQSNSIKIFGLGILAVLVFAALAGFAPVQAHAQVYHYPYNNSYQYHQPVYHSGTIYAAPTTYYEPTRYIQPTTYVQPITYVQQPVYYSQPTYYYQPLSASCYAVNTSVQLGTQVEWVASAVGGSGSYSYTWYGTDGMSGYGSNLYANYADSGIQTASVTVYSNGQSVTVDCGSSVNVYQPYAYAQPTIIQPISYVQQPQLAYAPSNDAGLDIGCYADPTTAAVDQPVTWTAEVTGGIGPYTYSWSGSDDLSGNGSSVTKYYSTGGDKSAIVSVTSANGQTGTRACSNSLAVRGNAPSYALAYPRVQQAAPHVQPAAQSNPLPAAAAISIGGLPWGWVAVLVILVLFATIMYLLFNRPKI